MRNPRFVQRAERPVWVDSSHSMVVEPSVLSTGTAVIGVAGPGEHVLLGHWRPSISSKARGSLEGFERFGPIVRRPKLSKGASWPATGWSGG
jgi:hypothetical protein